MYVLSIIIPAANLADKACELTETGDAAELELKKSLLFSVLLCSFLFGTYNVHADDSPQLSERALNLAKVEPHTANLTADSLSDSINNSNTSSIITNNGTDLDIDLLPIDSTAITRINETLNSLEAQHGPYDFRLQEPLTHLALSLQTLGEHRHAINFYKRAFHNLRINHGLYHGGQLALLERLIESEQALGEWDEVTKRYIYLAHLYQRLYKADDVRLQRGLHEVGLWHISAFNRRVGSDRVEHLKQAKTLFEMSLQVASLSLNADDPKFEILKDNIKSCDHELFLNSEFAKQMQSQSRDYRPDEEDFVERYKRRRRYQE